MIHPKCPFLSFIRIRIFQYWRRMRIHIILNQKENMVMVAALSYCLSAAQSKRKANVAALWWGTSRGTNEMWLWQQRHQQQHNANCTINPEEKWKFAWGDSPKLHFTKSKYTHTRTLEYEFIKMSQCIKHLNFNTAHIHTNKHNRIGEDSASHRTAILSQRLAASSYSPSTMYEQRNTNEMAPNLRMSKYFWFLTLFFVLSSRLA